MKGATELREEALDLSIEEPERAYAVALEALELEPGPASLYVLGVVLAEQGDSEGAMQRWHEALRQDANHVDSWAALGRENFEQGDFEAAAVALLTALRLEPLHPSALYYRACLRERRGDPDGALRDYTAAALVDPEEYPAPVPMAEAEMVQSVRELLAELPPELRHYLRQVPIVLEDVPDLVTLMSFHPPVSPTTLLGSVQGPSLAEREAGGLWNLPPTIHLYRCNLKRVAGNPEKLREELRNTFLHELRHFLGIDDEPDTEEELLN